MITPAAAFFAWSAYSAASLPVPVPAPAPVPVPVPDVVTLTAVLEENGAPLDRPVVATFSLWNARDARVGEALWRDEERAILVNGGVLSVEIGGGSRPLPQHVFAQETWLDVVIDGVHMEPRIRITSAPRALEARHAAHAETCSMLGNLDEDDIATRAMLDEAVDSLSDDVNVAIDDIVDINDVQWLRLYRRPAACGGGLAMEGTCNTIPCPPGEASGFGYLDCSAECTSDVPRPCAANAVGWMRGL